jgi:hypothetical protein
MLDFLSVIAFLMALGAVFLANDAIRKAESKNDAFIKGHVDSLKEKIKQNANFIQELRDELNEMNETNQNKLKTDQDRLDKVEETLIKLSTDLSELNESIMPQALKKPHKKA